ncbi:peptidylprolyl isomerase [Spirulina sp. CCNP1310]|nr:peptidylprolyl isomerase [Spirulina sp. CCNP1310]
MTVDNELITLSQALKYWKNSGIFSRMLQEVLQQHCLKKELDLREDLKVDNFELDQACVEFRVQNQLTDGDIFQKWLSSNNFTYKKFQERIAFALKLEQLKSEIVEPQLEEYFKKQKPFLDCVILSRLILGEQDLAEKLKQQIIEDRGQFEPLVQEYSLTDDRTANGMMGAVPKGQMPDILRTALDSANPGELIGPLEIDGRYCLFCVHQFLPASLEEEPLKQELKNQLFDQWLQEKIKSLDIRLEVK